MNRSSTAHPHPFDVAALRDELRAFVAALPIVILVRALRGHAAAPSPGRRVRMLHRENV